MQYLYFPGCKLHSLLPHYDRSTRAILEVLNVHLVDRELNCCGYPVRHLDFTAAMLAGARVLAVAASMDLPLLTPCKCCFGNLKQADYWMQKDAVLRDRINGILKKEALHWQEGVKVRHLLNALNDDVGLTHLQQQVRGTVPELKVAVHYGCHALRPGDVTRFDNPLAPTIFENIVALTGAHTVNWPLRLECCGYPLWGKNNRLSLDLMQRKLTDARAAGAQMLLTACTYCQLQFDDVRHQQPDTASTSEQIPAVLVSQLLGRVFGLDLEDMGCHPDSVLHKHFNPL